MRGLKFGALGVVAVIAMGGVAAAQDQIRVKPVDFALPDGIEAKLPADVPISDVFVTDDFCFYYRYEGEFFFVECVG